MFQSKTHAIDDTGDRIIRKSSVPHPTDEFEETVENLEKTIELAKYIEVIIRHNINLEYIINQNKKLGTSDK